VISYLRSGRTVAETTAFVRAARVLASERVRWFTFFVEALGRKIMRNIEQTGAFEDGRHYCRDPLPQLRKKNLQLTSREASP
jgi:hypothetical protein